MGAAASVTSIDQERRHNYAQYGDARIVTELPIEKLEELTPLGTVINSLQKAVESGNESLGFLALGR